MKKSSRNIFLILILILSSLPRSFTPRVQANDNGEGYGFDGAMDYVFVEGNASLYDVMYDDLDGVGPISIVGTEVYYSTSISTQRKIVRLTDGTLYVVYRKELAGKIQIYVKQSANNGTTWTDETRISTRAGMQNEDQLYASLAVDSNDYLHVVWSGDPPEPGSEDIWYTNYTSSWSVPIQLTTHTGSQTLPTIVVDSSDYLHVLWRGVDYGYTWSAIWYTNYTTSWSNPLCISDDGIKIDYNQKYPSAAIDSYDVIHVVWVGRDLGYGWDQVWYSNDAGIGNWSTSRRISTADGMADDYDQGYASISVGSDDDIHVVWSAKATGFTTNRQIWYATRAGTSWVTPIRISTYEGMSGNDQECATIATDSSDYIHVLWSGKATGYTDYNKVWYAEYTDSWATPECLHPTGQNRYPNIRGSRWPGAPLPYTWKANVTLTDLNVPGFNFTESQTVDVFDWGSSFGDSAFWYTLNSEGVSPNWVFEGKRRYYFQIDYENETLSTVEQFGLRFTDEVDQTHTIWYDRDANTLTVTSPYDGISGWITYFNQADTEVTALFQIMFNTPIPDSYDVQLEIKVVAATDSGWLTPDGGIFNIYNLGGLSTLYKSGTADRVLGGDVFEIYAADTRTRNVIPTQDFDVRYSSLSPGLQILGVQIYPAEDEQKLLDELIGWKTWMTSRTEARTIYPTNRLPATGSSGDTTYHSYPFGLLIKSDSTLNESLIIEREFFRTIHDTDGEIVTAEVWATVANDTKITGQILISDDGYVDDLRKGVETDTKRIVEFKFFGNGNIRLLNGTNYIYPATYTGMVWANYTFVMNLTAQTYDFYVDEVLNVSSVEFREAATSVGHISFLDTLNPVFPAQPVEFYVDDVWVHTDFDEDYGGIAEATMLFDMNQHWSMDFDFFVENGEVYAQGVSGTPQRVGDDYSNHGYVELGWDVMIDKTLVHDFLVARVNITDGYISGKNDWVKFNVTWYHNGIYVKNDLLYGLFEGYSIFPGSSKDTCGWHWDIWFNRANASTVIGARLNTEYFGMSDKSVWWAVWSSKWTPMRTEVSDSTLFIDLEDVNGTIHSAQDISFVRSWVQVYRNTEAQFAYKVINIAGLDFLIARDTMSGIDTPPIRETIVPDVVSGFFGSALGGIFSAALKRLGNTLAGFGMGFFTMSIAFIDNIFAALGYPALVSTIFGWMDSLFGSVPILVGYGITMIGQVFNLINTSAGDALTQLTSIITIWVGMYSTMMDFLSGVLTPGFNLWNDLGISSFIQVGAIMYPLWLLILASEKGMQALIDHLTGVLNIGSFFLNFILNVGGFFMGLLTGLIGAIRG